MKNKSLKKRNNKTLKKRSNKSKSSKKGSNNKIKYGGGNTQQTASTSVLSMFNPFKTMTTPPSNTKPDVNPTTESKPWYSSFFTSKSEPPPVNNSIKQKIIKELSILEEKQKMLEDQQKTEKNTNKLKQVSTDLESVLKQISELKKQLTPTQTKVETPTVNPIITK